LCWLFLNRGDCWPTEGEEKRGDDIGLFAIVVVVVVGTGFELIDSGNVGLSKENE